MNANNSKGFKKAEIPNNLMDEITVKLPRTTERGTEEGGVRGREDGKDGEGDKDGEDGEDGGVGKVDSASTNEFS